MGDAESKMMAQVASVTKMLDKRHAADRATLVRELSDLESAAPRGGGAVGGGSLATLQAELAADDVALAALGRSRDSSLLLPVLVLVLVLVLPLLLPLLPLVLLPLPLLSAPPRASAPRPFLQAARTRSSR